MPIFLKRGEVYKIKYVPPDTPEESGKKYVVCLQEGKIVENDEDFVCARITTKKLDKIYPWEVKLSPEESHSKTGAKVQCNKIHTFLKVWIIEHAYGLTDATMREIDEKLMLGVGIEKFENIQFLFKSK